MTITLHTANIAEGKVITVYNANSGSCTVTSTGNGLHDGNVVLAQGRAGTFAWNLNSLVGAWWWNISKN